MKTQAGAVAAAAVMMAAALAAPPVRADEVNVYTERQEVFLRDVFAGFTAATGVKVNALYLANGAIERLASEGEHTVADVVIVADVGRLQELEDRGLTQEIDAGVIGAAPHSDARQWVALTRRLRVLFVPQDSPAAAEEMAGLAAARWRGGLCLRSGFHPYNVALFANYLGLHGEQEARALIDGVKANLARRPQGNDRAQIKGVASGQCKAAVANLYYYHKMLAGDDAAERKAAEAVRWLPLRMDAEGVHANVSGGAIARHSKRPAAAARLLEYMLSAEAQRIYAAANGELPVRRDVAMPAALQAAAALPVNGLPIGRIASLRPAAAALVAEAAFDD
ncbi:MAG: extracellular solute-binding protein [Betaproteobacteria bacterium AqS2]|uniref:Extracellular solute-binding protein n=1 Tax=Candidatus Amphirhobacter heronislandensis TaxID=1732024 RepID=A0A930Y2U6_9GAMM|nr:extracellular solute-binding protein [Betaproteobacteria bacterium AqS2]